MMKGKKEATIHTPAVLAQAIKVLEASVMPIRPSELMWQAAGRKSTSNGAFNFMQALGEFDVRVWQDVNGMGGKRDKTIVGLNDRHGLDE